MNAFLDSQPLALLMEKAAVLERIISEARHDGDSRWREPARQLRIIRATIQRKQAAHQRAPVPPPIPPPIIAAVDPDKPPPITIKMDALKLSVRPGCMGNDT